MAEASTNQIVAAVAALADAAPACDGALKGDEWLNCFIPSLAYEQFRAPAAHPSTEQARSARHQARSRGFWDFCESEERLYESIQTCFAQA